MLGNAKRFAGSALEALKQYGTEVIANPKMVATGAAIGAGIGIPAGYVGGRVAATPSADEQYQQVYNEIKSVLGDNVRPEDIDYETQRLLYDHQGNMTPLMQGGNWEEFAQKQAKKSQAMPLDSTGTEVGYM